MSDNADKTKDTSHRKAIVALGIEKEALNDLRKKILAPDDWYRNGKTAIYYRASGMAKLRQAVDSVRLEQVFIEGRVVKPCRNPRFVAATTDGKDTVYCAIPQGTQRRLTRGKPIKMEVISEVTGYEENGDPIVAKSYRHEWLAR